HERVASICTRDDERRSEEVREPPAVGRERAVDPRNQPVLAAASVGADQIQILGGWTVREILDEEEDALAVMRPSELLGMWNVGPGRQEPLIATARIGNDNPVIAVHPGDLATTRRECRRPVRS